MPEGGETAPEGGETVPEGGETLPEGGETSEGETNQTGEVESGEENMNFTCAQFIPVQSGDTCFRLWISNGLTEDEFFDLNPDIDCSLLQIGQEICIRGLSNSKLNAIFF